MSPYKLTWVFFNEHQCSQEFNSVVGMLFYMNINGLLSHPDIVEVFSTQDNVKVFYKRRPQ